MPVYEVFYCELCKADVPLDGTTEKKHRRIFHQAQVSAKFPDDVQALLFNRNEAGVFSCTRCAFIHPNAQTFGDHVRRPGRCPARLSDNGAIADTDALRSAHFSMTEHAVEVSATPPSPFTPGQTVGDTRSPSTTSTSTNEAVSTDPPEGLSIPPCTPPPGEPPIPHSQPPLKTSLGVVLGADTITEDAEHDLARFNLVINTAFRLVICLSCGKAVSPHRLGRHLVEHWTGINVPKNLGAELQLKYDLIEPADWIHPTSLTSPIYGLSVSPQELHFCGHCYHGFATEALRVNHQYRPQCGLAPGAAKTSFRALGQSVGFNARGFFPVDSSLLVPRVTPEPSRIFTALPRPDYAQLPISKPHNANDLDLLFKNEEFYSLVEHLTPAQLNETISIPTKTPAQRLLRQRMDSACKAYCVRIHHTVKQSSSALLKLMAQLTADSSREELRPLELKSVDEYALALSRLLTTMLRCANNDPLPLEFPLSANQRVALAALGNVLTQDAPPAESASDGAVHQAAFVMFAHHKAHGGLDHWVLPVNRYLVASCMGKTTWLRANDITRTCAKLQWINRGVMLREMHIQMPAQKLSSEEAYGLVRRYVTANSDTPCAFIYDIHHTVKKIRDEYNDADVQMENEANTQLIFNGNRIHLHQFRHLLQKLDAQYRRILEEDVFFRKGIPTSCFPPFEIETLTDRPQNFAPGFCFLDIPTNGFEAWGELYPQWLMSHDDLADRFTYVVGECLHWKLGPCHKLLGTLERLRMILAVRTLVSCGPSVRATEFASQSLRNVAGGTIRNVILLYHALCLIAVLEKNSMQFSRKHCIPHCPVKSVAKDLIWNLTIFRPLERRLISTFKGHADAERYYTSLWPGVQRDFTGEEISSSLGDWTETGLGCRLQILDYRKVVSAFCRHIIDPFLSKSIGDSFFDELQNHSTQMGYMRYGVDTSTWLRTGECTSSLTVAAIKQAVLESLHSTPLISKAELEEPLTDIISSLAALWFPKPPTAPIANSLSPISSHATWTCAAQAELLECMRMKKRHILAILSCNSGKTTTILLQSKIFDVGCSTVFILPVSVGKWNPSHASFNGDFDVLYVAVEQITDELMNFLRGLIAMRKLASFVSMRRTWR
ncbi:unnamed protein product [Mycena citricolor]|uniref:Uncharacterized protein n=1 Tax=Mycena citricolor TaxID=2018698 RepID=A0AAD2JZJ5_9AGAR|nr:unnamed protein product [Mycena citricolor]